MAVGRAIQLGYLSMEDLNKPVVSFLKNSGPLQADQRADQITLHEAMHMSSGIRLPQKKIDQLIDRPERLLWAGTGSSVPSIQRADLPLPPRVQIPSFRSIHYHASASERSPGFGRGFHPGRTAQTHGHWQHQWQEDLSGLPKSAAGSSLLSRDMIKMGLLVLDGGKWKGKQHLPEAFVKQATPRSSKQAQAITTATFGGDRPGKSKTRLPLYSGPGRRWTIHLRSAHPRPRHRSDGSQQRNGQDALGDARVPHPGIPCKIKSHEEIMPAYSLLLLITPSLGLAKQRWMEQSRFGLMFHYEAFVDHSPESYNQTVDSFDVQGFTHAVASTQADYIIFVIGQHWGKYRALRTVLMKNCSEWKTGSGPRNAI